MKSAAQILFEAAVATGGIPAEPRVSTDDVSAVLWRAVEPGHDQAGLHASVIAHRAGCSKRTVQRVLYRTAPYDKDSMLLDVADRLLLAVGAHLSDVRVFD